MSRRLGLVILDGLDPQVAYALQRPEVGIVDHPNRDRILESIKDRMVPVGQAPVRAVPGGLETAWAIENTPKAFGALMDLFGSVREVDQTLISQIVESLSIPGEPFFDLPAGTVEPAAIVSGALQAFIGKKLTYFWY